MSTKVWVITSADKDRPTLYWIGFQVIGDTKDHRFSRDVSQAIKFVTGHDALRAGVNLTKGIVVREIEYCLPSDMETR